MQFCEQMEILHHWTVLSHECGSQNDCNKCPEFYNARSPHPQGIYRVTRADLSVPSCAQLVIQFRVAESKRLIFRGCATSSTRSVCKNVKRDLKFFGFCDSRESSIRPFSDTKTPVLIYLGRILTILPYFIKSNNCHIYGIPVERKLVS